MKKSSMMCRLFGHRYLTEFGTPFELDADVPSDLIGVATIGVLMCSRCGNYVIVPSFKLGIPKATPLGNVAPSKPKAIKGKTNG